MKHDPELSVQLQAVSAFRTDSTIGPLGERLTLKDLPPPNSRWTARRKAEVVAAVHGGLLAMAVACQSYNISTEEFEVWERAVERAGLRGLRVTHAQKYRKLLAGD